MKVMGVENSSVELQLWWRCPFTGLRVPCEKRESFSILYSFPVSHACSSSFVLSTGVQKQGLTYAKQILSTELHRLRCVVQEFSVHRKTSLCHQIRLLQIRIVYLWNYFFSILVLLLGFAVSNPDEIAQLPSTVLQLSKDNFFLAT